MLSDGSTALETNGNLKLYVTVELTLHHGGGALGCNEEHIESPPSPDTAHISHSPIPLTIFFFYYKYD